MSRFTKHLGCYKSNHYLAFHFIDFFLFLFLFFILCYFSIHFLLFFSFYIPRLPFKINTAKVSKLQNFHIVHHHVRRRHQSQQISQTTGSFSATSCSIPSLSMPLPCLYILYGRALQGLERFSNFKKSFCQSRRASTKRVRI